MGVLKFEELTAIEIAQLCQENRVMLLSFGSIEQHSSHLPVGTDYLCMGKRVEEIAQQTNSVMFSPLQLGYSFHHLGMVGTISLEAETFIEIVRGILCQLFRQGWQRVLIFSGHNGNWPVLRVAGQMAREEYPDTQLIFAEGYPKMDEVHCHNRFIRNFDYHAGLTETALVAYLLEGKVAEDALPTPNHHVPKRIKKIMAKRDLDEIDTLLLCAVTPQHTEKLSQNGMWGVNDPAQFRDIPAQEAMDTYVRFYVQLIKRWDGLVG